MKTILGSGVVGMLARVLLGDSWTLIPFYRSRFFSYNPPLDDNYLTWDQELDSFVQELGFAPAPVMYRRAYSLSAQLLFDDPTGELCNMWLTKLFGTDQPPHASPYLSSRLSFFVYDQVRLNRLYVQLQERYKTELMEQASLGGVIEIGDHYFVRQRKGQAPVRQEFEKAVSTIPLSALLKLMGRDSGLRYRPAHYLHMQTEALSFEGASQVLVVDPMFSFYKVNSLARGRYLFHAGADIPNPGAYFMPIIPGDYDLVDGTMLSDALPLGPMPDLSGLEAADIFPVGSYAQHDWCADVGSNVLRLMRYCNRGGKSVQRNGRLA